MVNRAMASEDARFAAMITFENDEAMAKQRASDRVLI